MGGIIGVMSIVGMILIKEPSATDKKDNQNKSLTQDIISLRPVEVLKTHIFYMVLDHIAHTSTTLGKHFSDLDQFLCHKFCPGSSCQLAKNIWLATGHIRPLPF